MAKKQAIKAKTDKKQLKPMYYVGIGASAGGLEALESFVKPIPERSGHVYIVVQHLSPDFKSMMPELLARHTKVPIEQIVKDVVLQPDHIYLAPPRKFVLVAEGKAMLVDQMESEKGHYPIDVFLRSLAEDQHHQCVSVIMSGTGSDGSRGVQAIKEVGGLVMVQEPSDASFDGMPFNAIKTGCADVVLPAKDMVEKILQYTNHPILAGAEETQIEENDLSKASQDIFELLSHKSNIDFSHYKNNTIQRRIGRRLGINGFDSLSEYYEYLLSNPKELSLLAQDMLIGVTSFFRDKEAFSYLEKEVIPAIVDASQPDEIIRIWSACCSSGEEAYSLAMLIDEALKRRKINRTVRIFATDVDINAINEAGAGRFPLNIASDMTEERISEYFELHDDYYSVEKNLRKMVVFAQHDVLKDPPFSNCQLALCRNALIYFQPQAQNRVLSMLHFALNQGGYLFLGSSESLGEVQSHFEVCHERNRIYKKITNVKLLVEAIPAVNKTDSIAKVPSVRQLLMSTNQVQKLPQYMSILETIIGDYAPPAIVLSEEQDVLHVFGDISPFTQKLRPGKFSSNINDFLDDNLSVPVSTAIYRAKTSERSISYNDIQFKPEDGVESELNLRVLYFNSNKMANTYFVILFEPMEKQLKALSAKDDVIDTDDSRQLIRDLEDALRKKQEDLQVTVEELQTTNEELQSSNEELMAANEELQSTNEELQSVNEELYTVNAEYQEQIEAVNQANLDMDNVINSGEISFIFLDEALLIRKFSKMAADEINLLPSDIGRPFHHISHALDYDQFLNDIASVINDAKLMEVKVFNANRELKLIRLSPYVNEDDEVSGCVINIIDISQIQTLENRLAESWKELRSTVNASLLAKEKTVKVLIVDDESIDRRAVIKALKTDSISESDYEIHEAETYDMAKKMLEKNIYDVCILDFHLAGHDGFELIAGLNKVNEDIAYILLSGSVTNQIRKDAIKHNVFDVLQKEALSPALIHRSVHYALSHGQTERFLLKQGLVS